MEEIAVSPSIRTVYLAGFWASDNYRAARIDRALDQTIATLQSHGKAVVLIGPIPAQRQPVPRLLALQGADAATLPADRFSAALAWFTGNYPDWRARGVQIIEPLDRLTRDGNTMIVAGGTPLYYDSHHLSLAGARYLLGEDIAARPTNDAACPDGLDRAPTHKEAEDGKVCSHWSQGPDGPRAGAGDRGGRP